MPDSFDERVCQVVRRMNLLDEHGDLVPLDSLTVADLIFELGRELKLNIPSTAIRAESFQSLPALQQRLRELAG